MDYGQETIESFDQVKKSFEFFEKLPGKELTGNEARNAVDLGTRPKTQPWNYYKKISIKL